MYVVCLLLQKRPLEVQPVSNSDQVVEFKAKTKREAFRRAESEIQLVENRDSALSPWSLI